MASTSRKTGSSSAGTSGKSAKTPAKKPSSAASGNRTASSARSSSAAKKPSGSGASGSRSGGRRSAPADRTILREIAAIFLIAFCIFLFCSNMGFCGPIGHAVKNIQLGCFGICAYLFPVGLPAAVIYVSFSRDKLRAGIKTAAAVLVCTVLCGAVELIVGKFTEENFGWADFYRRAQTEAGGGLIGALWCKLLYPSFGVFGTYLILVVLMLAGLLLITEKSLLRPLRRGGERVYSSAKEDMERRREEREIRRREREAERGEKLEAERAERRYRMDNPVKGVARNTELTPPIDREKTETEKTVKTAKTAKAEPQAETVRAEAKATAKKEPEKTVSAGESFREPTISGLDAPARDGEDVLVARSDSRTLSELESLDSLRSGFSVRRTDTAPDVLYMPKDRLVRMPGDGSRITAPDPILPEPVSEDVSPADGRDGIGERPEEKLPDIPEFPDGPDVSDAPEPERETRTEPAQDQRGGDTVRIVTASGRVIEADNDPTVDPLAAKRAGMTQGQAGMTSRERLRVVGGSGNAAREAAATSADGRRLSAAESRTAAGTQTAAPKPKPRPYEKPPLRFLAQPEKKTGTNRDDLYETAAKLQQTLQNFGVGATVTNISCGPSVTRYELIPDQGVKVSKFLSLTDDIKLNLAAADIRIEAPIPGKSAIGIEVPNREKTSVFLREVLESEEFLKHPSRLAIAVGKDIAGNNIVADLARMPHLLVAGTTGSGKSVFVNCMIVSMLYKARPDEVKFIMIDPKMVEFGIYNGIPHLLSPVVTDPKKAAEVLNWAVAQMTDRYKKFAELNVRDIKGYNEKQKAEAGEGETPDFMPQIVIIVDELSDLMMVASNEVEDAIVRLAQMARAAGIHLILATQRPTVNVVTGLIKANIPSRVALSVSTGTDSRTIIDMNGAEKLLGNGDMLFYPSGYQKPLRVQGAYVSDGEINRIVSFLSGQGEAQFDASIEERMESGGRTDSVSSDRDEYFERAGRFITESGKASIGNLQRMFKIGFNRAARIMDQLAACGVVGAEEGTKARKILMTKEEFEEYLGEGR